MNREQLLRHTEGKWSASDILEHLCRAFSTSVPHLQKCLDRDAPTASRSTLRQWFQSTVVADLGYFPEGRSAPPFTRPQGMAPEETLKQIRQHLAAMDSVLQECERRFGARVKLADHPVLGPLSVGQWRKFHWVHTRHHMKQIARLRQMN